MSQDVIITHPVGIVAIILVAATALGWAARKPGRPSIVGQCDDRIAPGGARR